jgi:hypothetical protein
VGAASGAVEVVGVAWGMAEVDEAANDGATRGWVVLSPGVVVGPLASVPRVV